MCIGTQLMFGEWLYIYLFFFTQNLTTKKVLATKHFDQIIRIMWPTSYLCHCHSGKRIPNQLLFFTLVAPSLSLEYPRCGQRRRAHSIADQKHHVFRPSHLTLEAGQPFFQCGSSLFVPMVTIWKKLTHLMSSVN